MSKVILGKKMSEGSYLQRSLQAARAIAAASPFGEKCFDRRKEYLVKAYKHFIAAVERVGVDYFRQYHKAPDNRTPNTVYLIRGYWSAQPWEREEHHYETVFKRAVDELLGNLRLDLHFIDVEMTQEQYAIVCRNQRIREGEDKPPWYLCDPQIVMKPKKSFEWLIEEKLEGLIEDEAEWDHWDDPGDYPSNAGASPLPSESWVAWRDKGDEDELTFTADDLATVVHEDGVPGMEFPEEFEIRANVGGAYVDVNITVTRFEKLSDGGAEIAFVVSSELQVEEPDPC
jgi:hypothetical protein